MVVEIFNRYAERYDSWYERHKDLFIKEVEFLRDFVDDFELGLEVGVGTGRFARELGISIGVDLAESMLRLARSRGVQVLKADARILPFKDESFDLVLFAFTLCFLEDPERAISEAYRVLKGGGRLIVCGVPLDSKLGEEYSKRDDSPFYRAARLYRVEDVIRMLEISGFEIERIGYLDLKYGKDVFCASALK